MLLNKLLLVGVLCLTGCATQQPPIKVITQQVEVPISVPCKEVAPVVPDYCFNKLSVTSDIFDKTKCLLSDRDLSIGYQTELLAKFNSCK